MLLLELEGYDIATTEDGNNTWYVWSDEEVQRYQNKCTKQNKYKYILDGKQ